MRSQLIQDLNYCESEAFYKFKGGLFSAGVNDNGNIIISLLNGEPVGHAWYDKKDNSILHIWLISEDRFINKCK